MKVHFIDTSVLAVVLDLPGFCDSSEIKKKISEELKHIINEKNECLILPFATIIETGNHIAHCNDGRIRRSLAEKFSEVIEKTINNEMPWQYYGQQLTSEDLHIICKDFPDKAMCGVGFGDMSIIRAYERYKDETPAVSEIRIWSLDEHFASYHEQLKMVPRRN